MPVLIYQDAFVFKLFYNGALEQSTLSSFNFVLWGKKAVPHLLSFFEK